MLRQLNLILWKNLKLRQRHFLLTIIEVIIPVISFTLIAYGRAKIDGLNKIELNETHHEPYTTDELFSHLPVGELTLWYAPYTNSTYKIIDKVQETFQIPEDAIRGFTSEEELMKCFTKSKEKEEKFIAALFFREDDPLILSYEIGIHDKHITWHTNELFVPNLAPEDTNGPANYIYKGFVALQIAINLAFIKLTLKNDLPKITITAQRFPQPPRTIDPGIQQLFVYYLPLITFFSFIFIFPAVLKRVSEEKDSGAKEFMKMVGMKSWVIWFGWLIHAISTNLFSVIVIVVLMKVPMWDVPYPPIEFSDGVILLLFLFLYCMATVTFCFLIGTLINRPRAANITGILIWIFSFFISQNVVAHHENLSWRYKILFGIFPNMALHYGYSAISLFEMRNVGVQWYNIKESASGGQNNITMTEVYSILIFDMIIFMLLTIYIENVKPGKYGIPKPLCYPVQKLRNEIFSTFLNVSKIFRSRSEQQRHDLLDSEKGTSYIEINGLFKKFGHCVAIDNLNMDVAKENITILLGQNGAGKSTMMLLLTGMIKASRGTIRINGQDINKQTDEIRPKIGLCPQHNLLFPDLTVTEHLKFFGKLRGLSNREAQNQAKKILEMFEMTDKMHFLAHALSGGMKRKLCLGMALIGNTELLVLDEPTLGMDPESRRKVWKLLQEQKKSKTILITTHFMEEADAIGDRIAIMANGKLQCYGTPMDLKRKYNTGYHLSLMLKSKKSLKVIQQLIKCYIQDAFILREHADNIVFVIPSNEKQKISRVVYKLEERQNEWGIINIGINITTLNDVFLKARTELDGEDATSVHEILTKYNEEIMKLKKSPTLYKQIKSLWLKRWYLLRRNYFWYFPSAAVSLSIFLLALSLATQNCSYCKSDGSKLNLNLDIYGKTEVNYNVSKAIFESDSLNYFYSLDTISQSGNPVWVNNVAEEIVKKGIDNIAYYNKHMIVAAEFHKNDDELSINCLYSNRAYHGLPISVNLVTNALFKTFINENASVSVTNAPLRSVYVTSKPNELSEIGITILWSFLFPTGMLLFMSGFMIFPYTEIPNKFLQIQVMAGVKIWVYWLINIIFDLFICFFKLVPLFLIIGLMKWMMLNAQLFTVADFYAFGVIFGCHSISSLPFTYLFSYRSTIAGGFSLFFVFGFLTGIILGLILQTIEIYTINNHILSQILTVVAFVFAMIFPHFGLSYATIRFTRKFVENFNWIHMDPDKKKYICSGDSDVEYNPCCYGNTKECSKYQNYFSNEKLGIQWILLAMIASFVLYFLILCLWNTIYILGSSRRRIAKLNNKEVILEAKELTKSYGIKTVLKNLKLELKKYHCFGLLGVNGAGKSTTFDMLTRNVPIEKESKIVIQENETPIDISDANYLEKIGYCPQKELNYSVTGRELLWTIAYLRGYSDKDADKIVSFLLNLFGLQKYAGQPCSEYSGGTKRKLSCCLAFLGFPSVILLDEPTNSIDPSARRDFWNVLSILKNDRNLNISFLLCSHSMEECEALCDEIGILANGSIEHEGSLPELRKTIKNDYVIEVKVKDGTQKDLLSESIRKILQCEFIVDDQNTGLLRFYVKHFKNTLSKLFTLMESLENEIDDYVISQSSLEDIFLEATKEMTENYCSKIIILLGTAIQAWRTTKSAPWRINKAKPKYGEVVK